MKGWPGEPDMEYDVLMADGEAAANAGKPNTELTGLTSGHMEGAGGTQTPRRMRANRLPM